MDRVQKILAAAGVDSRRKCEELIQEGLVKVNGKVVALGATADPIKDKITVSGRIIRLEKKVYLILNKPRGYVTTVHEQFGMPTIMDLVRVQERVFPVGRLDKDAEGLLLLTNDGELSNRLLHPRYEIEKTYIAITKQPLKTEDNEKLRKGIRIEGRQVKARARKLEQGVQLTIHEGRKHIVKLILKEIGHSVMRLKRIQFGSLKLGKLPKGRWRKLRENELKELG